jgi:blue copper oxidase
MRHKIINQGLILFIIIIGAISVLLFSMFSRLLNIDESPSNQIRMLPIPILLEPFKSDTLSSEYQITVQKGTTNFIKELQTPTLGYNGNYLGPVIKLSRGEEVTMHVKNNLSVDTSIHWHGLEVEGSSDGGPHQVISAGSTWQPTFTVNQPASTLWFHPHVIGRTATQVYYGLAGLIIVEDEHSQSLNLPDDYGVNDIPLIIQDRSFNQDGSLRYTNNMMDGASGQYILVNGAITPTLNVSRIKMRFRILNGANASNFNVRLQDNHEFVQIASDGGLLEKPVLMNSLFISPGERAEIIIDFSSYQKGQKVRLLSNKKVIMSFVVSDDKLDETSIPNDLATIERFDESLVKAIRTIELDGMGHMVTLNGRQFDMHRIDERVKQNELEIWEITSIRSMMMGGLGHPFHIHGTQFQILSRNGQEPQANEKGWKDTVFVRSGETVRIIVKFKYLGTFMYHCHILEHEEAGMMGQLIVE